MARIPEYEAPDRQIAASDKGASAFEQAGRRIGPAYNEAATLQRQAGEAQAAVIRQRRWPFDMLQLQRSLEEGKGTSKGTSGGVGIKLAGGVNNLEHEKEGGGSGSSGDTKPSSRSRLGNDVGATSLAAGALGKLASRMGATGQYHNSNIDPQTGLDMNLLRPTPTKVLENGELVDAKKQSALDAKSDRNGALGAEGFALEQRAGWYDDPNNVKKFRDKYGYDPNTGKMVDSSSYTGGDTPYVGGTSANGDRYLSGSPSYGNEPSGTDAFAPDSSAVPTGGGGAGTRDFWSDLTDNLEKQLTDTGSQLWNDPFGTGSKDYGGGSDDSAYSDLSGEGAQ